MGPAVATGPRPHCMLACSYKEGMRLLKGAKLMAERARDARA